MRLICQSCWRDILLLLPLPFVALSFLLIPFTNDVRIFQGVARIMDLNGNFPMSLDTAWEIKPLGNRLIPYVTYKIVTLFTPIGSSYYSFLTKLIALIIVLICCWFIASRFKDQFVPVFSISVLALITASNFSQLQPEWWSVLFSVFAFSLLLVRGKYRYCAYTLFGFVMVYIFLLKGITGLMIIPILCAAYLFYDTDEEFLQTGVYALISFLFAGFCFFILCLTIFPYAIPDMMMSAQLARVGQLPFAILINSMSEKLLTIGAFIPFLLSAFVIGFVQLATIKLPWKKYLALLLVWIVPFLVVFIQGEFFIYHYVPFIFSGIISIALASKTESPKIMNIIYAISVGSMLVLYILFCSQIGTVTILENQIFKSEIDHSNEAKAMYDIEAQPSTLFLDPGSSLYWFHTNSSCRYSTPLPVQRYQNGWNTTNLKAYRDLYSCIMNYNGKYIIGLDWWFGRNLTERKEIYQKIDNEYTLVYNKSWDIYERKNATV